MTHVQILKCRVDAYNYRTPARYAPKLRKRLQPTQKNVANLNFLAQEADAMMVELFLSARDFPKRVALVHRIVNAQVAKADLPMSFCKLSSCSSVSDGWRFHPTAPSRASRKIRTRNRRASEPIPYSNDPTVTSQVCQPASVYVLCAILRTLLAPFYEIHFYLFFVCSRK